MTTKMTADTAFNEKMIVGYGSPAMNYFGAPQIAWDKPNEGEGGSGNDGGNDDDADANADSGANDGDEDGDEDGDDDADQGEDPAKLKAANAKLLKEAMKKKAALKAAEKKAADAAAALAAYDGVDPAKVKALIKAEQDAEAAAAEAKGDFDRVKQMMVEEHTREKKTLEDQIAELRAQINARDTTIGDLTIGTQFATSTFIRENLLLTPAKARKLYGSHFEMTGDGLVAYDKPAGEANRTQLVNASGDPLPFEEALKRLVDADPDRDTLLKVKLKPGSNSSTTTPEKTSKKEGVGEVYGVSRIAAGLGDFIKKS